MTGDAVQLDLRPARLPTRALATFVDLAVIVLILTVWSWVQEAVTGSGALVSGIGIVGSILGMLAYPITVETLTRGRTLGAFVLGLQVVRDDGGVVRFRHVLIRWLTFWFLDFAIWTGLAAGLICATVNRDGKRIGDLLAGTMVIRIRPPRGLGAAPDVDPELADWSSRLELSNVPDELMAAARTLVQRRDRMRAVPRTQLIEDVAHRIAARSTPAPPPGLDAEDFLAAVIAERRLRARTKLARVSDVPTAEQLPSGWR